MHLTLYYDGRLAATVDDEHATLSPAFDVYERDHPLRRFVAAMCLYLCDVVDGLAPAVALEEMAAAFARALLIPQAPLLERCDWPDVQLAEYFNVPLEEIAERRFDVESPARA